MSCCDHDHTGCSDNIHKTPKQNEDNTVEIENEDIPRNMSKNDIDEGWVDITPFKDGGLRKKMITQGIEGPKPPNNSKVKCHYVGTLVRNGKKFDSSRDRGDPFEFTIGTGGVIKGWDVGIATMNIGEKCILRCAPDYAYGKNGAGADIPPNAWLDFECELLSFDDWESFGNNYGISDDDIKKKIIKKPDDSKMDSNYNDESPEDESTAIVSFLGKYSKDDGKTYDGMFASGDNVEVVIDDLDEYPLGFIECIKELKIGQTVKFKILNVNKYGYGSSGNAKLGVPANAKLEYQITLNDFTKAKTKEDCTSKEKIDRALKYKMQGNDAFKKLKYERAIKKYESAVDFLDGNDTENDNELKQINDIKISCYNNQSLVYFKQKEYVKAKEFATKVLDIDGDNIKALLRRGQAKLLSGDWKPAKKDFLIILDKDKNNATAKKLLKTAKIKIKKYNQEQKNLYANMFKPRPSKAKKPIDNTTSTDQKTASDDVKPDVKPATTTNGDSTSPTNGDNTTPKVTNDDAKSATKQTMDVDS